MKEETVEQEKSRMDRVRFGGNGRMNAVAKVGGE